MDFAHHIFGVMLFFESILNIHIITFLIYKFVDRIVHAPRLIEDFDVREPYNTGLAGSFAEQRVVY